jgi:hypothetical protein
MDQSSISSVNIVKSWVYLPEPRTLSQYFNSNDLIELSKVCKKFRNQLKSQALKAIIIPQNCGKLYDIFNESCTYHYKFNDVKHRLKSDLLECHHLVDQVIFKHSITPQFVKDFFALFPNISRVTIENKSYNLKCLIEILHHTKSLYYINLRINSINYESIKADFHKFCKQLKSLKLIVPYDLDETELKFDFIDLSFTNLSYLTIVNNDVLAKLSDGLPSLRFVEFNEDCYFDKSILLKFILNNPQLKKITLAFGRLNYDIIDLVLKLKELNELNLTLDTEYNEIDISNCTENLTIKHVKCSGAFYSRSIIEIIKLCKSLKVLEISESSYRFLVEAAHNDELSTIDTLLIPRTFNAPSVCSFLPILNKFNQIKFRNGCNLGEIFDQQMRYSDVKWVPKQSYSSYTDEFTLIRRS